ncbi:hypothetical protein [Bradyrhizobium sp. HKCCYLRH1062]|uniref:hypothetical protein n=1 Tax=unclassified Bradyrhizobium TaxID=2631580 RepID=UPI003EC0CBB6
MKTAHELLVEINFFALTVAPTMPTDGLFGCSTEVETSDASLPNWTFRWRKLPENDHDLSLKLTELKETNRRIDWSGASREIPAGANKQI